MELVAEYRDARREEDVARLRRTLALRGMRASGMSQRQIAAALGVTQPAVSQQFKTAPDLSAVHPEVLVEAAAPIIVQLAGQRGFTRLAVFGAVARKQARADSDIDLLVDAPMGASIGDLLSLRDLLGSVLDRQVDLITYGALKPKIDDDIRREAVLL